jgi:hypothetical protein
MTATAAHTATARPKEEDRQRQLSRRDAACPEDVRQQVPRSPQDAHHESRRKHTVTASQLRDREAGPAEFLEDAGAQRHRHTDQHQRRLVGRRKDARENVRRGERKGEDRRNPQERSRQERHRVPPSGHAPFERAQPKLAKAIPSLNEGRQQNAGDAGAREHGEQRVDESRIACRRGSRHAARPADQQQHPAP